MNRQLDISENGQTHWSVSHVGRSANTRESVLWSLRARMVETEAIGPGGGRAVPFFGPTCHLLGLAGITLSYHCVCTLPSSLHPHLH